MTVAAPLFMGLVACVIGASVAVAFGLRDRRLLVPAAFLLGLAVTSATHLAAIAMQWHGRWATATLDITLMAACIAIAAKSPRPPTTEMRCDRKIVGGTLVTFFAFALLAAAGLAVCIAMAHPYGQWDAWAIWNLKAAFIHREPEHWDRMFSTLIPFIHGDYPLLLPLSVARLWRAAGAESTAVPAVLGALFMLITAYTLFATVDRLRGWAMGALAGATLLATPYFLTQGSLQLADVPVSLCLLTAVALAAMPRNHAGLIILAGVLIGVAAWTKNEGLVMTAALLAAIRLTSTGWRTVGLAALGAAPCAVLALGVKYWSGASSDLLTGLTFVDAIERVCDPLRHQMILEGVASAVCSGHSAVLAGAWLVYAFAAGLSRDPACRPARCVGSITILLMMLAYYGVYLVSPHDLAWHLETSLNRVMLQIWPTALLVGCACLRSPHELQSQP